MSNGTNLPATIDELLVLPTDTARHWIREFVKHVGDTADTLVQLAEHQAWKTLDYDTWDAFWREELQEIGAKPHRDQRPAFVARLRACGLTQQQIGDALGVAQTTVASDLRQIPDEAKPGQITDKTGRKRSPTRKSAPRKPKSEPGPAADAPPDTIVEEPPEPPTPVEPGKVWLPAVQVNEPAYRRLAEEHTLLGLTFEDMIKQALNLWEQENANRIARARRDAS